MAACKVKVCRICFTMDCQLHLLHENVELYKAYEAVTELALADEEDLPPYLCTRCADQLMNCVCFRHRSLQAHLMLLDILKNHGHISVESIQAVIKTTHFDSDNKHSEGKRTSNNNKVEIKHEDIPEDPIATKLVDRIKAEHIPDDVRPQDDSVGAEAVMCGVDTNNIVVKEEVVDEVSLTDDVNGSKLRTDPIAKELGDNIKTEYIPEEVGADDEAVVGLHVVEISDIVKEEVVLEVPVHYNVDDSTLGTGEGGSLLEDRLAHKDELKMVNANEGMKIKKELNQLEGVKKVETKLLQIDKLSSDLCNHGNDSETQFLSPLHSHAKTTLYYCYMCDFKTDSKKYILAHTTVHNGCKSGSGNVSGRSYSRKSSQIKNLKKDFSCNICEKSFRRKNVLQRHMLVHTGHKQYSCDVCDKSYYEKSSLRQHLLTHAGIKPFTCDICKRSFTTKSNLKTHLHRHYGDKRHKCDTCDKSFYQKAGLQYHLLTHLNDKPFTCDVCKKSFCSKYNLQTHMLIHSGDKPHSCDVCKQTFRIKSTLQHHMLIHSGDEPHKCDLCGKSFRRKMTLKLHLWKHSGHKPFVCELCQKSFSRKSVLQNHLLIHSGDKPHSCEVCGKSFQQKCNLQQHAQTHR